MRRLPAAALACAAALAAAPNAVAASSPTISCTFTTPTEAVETYAGVPVAIHAEIGTMAERDQPFQVSDVIVPGPQNPSRRLIRAWHRGNKWLVWYEQGGAAYSWHVAAFEVRPSGGLRALVRGIVPVQWTDDRWMPKTDVCQGIDQVLGL